MDGDGDDEKGHSVNKGIRTDCGPLHLRLLRLHYHRQHTERQQEGENYRSLLVRGEHRAPAEGWLHCNAKRR